MKHLSLRDLRTKEDRRVRHQPHTVQPHIVLQRQWLLPSDALR